MSDATGVLPIVLAGGQSRRMGTDKARLIRPGESEPLLERTCRLAHEATGNAALAAGRLRPLDWPADLSAVCFVPDPTPDAGPLAGLGAGLHRAAELGLGAVLLLPCDLPFLTVEALIWLLDAAAGNDGSGTAARHLNQIEPLFTVYRTVPCLPRVDACLARGQRSPLRFIQADGDFAFAPIPAQLLPVLHDADTPQEWEAAGI